MVWTFALSISIEDQVDRVGAYAGIAACLGLAILSVLYFAQAREVRRLREWAGRAPERAQELEARVVAGAREAREGAHPVAPGAGPTAPSVEDGTTDEGAGERPAAVNGDVPAGATTQAGAVPAGVAAGARHDDPAVAAGPVPDADAPATAASEADGETRIHDVERPADEAGRPGPVLIPPGAATPAGAAAAAAAAGAASPGAATPDGTTAGQAPTGASDATVPTPAPGAASHSATAPAGAPGAIGGSAAAPATPDAGGAPAAVPASSDPETAPGATPAGSAGLGAPAHPGDSGAWGPAPAGPGGSAPSMRRDDDAPVRLPRPAALPPSATVAGRQQRPAAPLRNPRPTATPRRPGGAAPPPARTGRSRTPLYAGAGLLAAAGIAIGVVTLTGGDEEPRQPAANTAATPTPTPDAAAPPAREETTVAVLNGTTQNGLASTISQQLVSAGYQKGDIATNTDQGRQETVVLYAGRARSAARDVARILEARRVEALDPATATRAGQGAKPDVVVVVGADQAP